VRKNKYLRNPNKALFALTLFERKFIVLSNSERGFASGATRFTILTFAASPDVERIAPASCSPRINAVNLVANGENRRWPDGPILFASSGGSLW
jgi:hypothetical protein